MCCGSGWQGVRLRAAWLNPGAIRHVIDRSPLPPPVCLAAALTEGDLFDAVSEEEAALDAQLRGAGAAASAEYGAKVGRAA